MTRTALPPAQAMLETEDAFAVLERVIEAGVDLWIDEDGTMKGDPGRLLTPELVRMIRANYRAIRAALLAERTADELFGRVRRSRFERSMTARPASQPVHGREIAATSGARRE